VAIIDVQSGERTVIRSAKEAEEGKWAVFSDPGPSHTGKTLAYSAWTNPHSSSSSLILHSMERGDEREIARGPLPEQITWAPADRELLFISRRDHQGLWRVGRDGGGLTRLTDQRVVDFAVASNGVWVAYVVSTVSRPTSYELWTVELATGKRRLLSDDAWSPSWHGDVVWYVGEHKPYPPSESSDYGFGRAIFEIAIGRSDGPKRLADAPDGEIIERAHISPDGEHFWAIVRRGSLPRSLYLLDIGEGKWLRVAENVRDVAWSGDGARLAWSTAGMPSEGRVFVAKLRPDASGRR
jgi:Tol biopolymer transport system component